jgi:hypothetical protein
MQRAGPAAGSLSPSPNATDGAPVLRGGGLGRMVATAGPVRLRSAGSRLARSSTG